MKHTWILCGLAMSVGTAAVAQPEVPQAPDRELTVASYNIRHAAGNDSCTTPPAEPGQPPNPNCALDLPRIATVIQQSGADIVGLQEVDRFWARSGTVDQPQELADMLGWHSCYGANLDHDPDRHSTVPHQYGTAILSRYPILECTNTFLPKANPPAGEQRGLLEALINVRGVPLRFYNTHLHTRLADRRVQTQAIAGLLDEGQGPAVLVGDLNARPDEDSLQVLYDRLIDVWPAAHPDDPGYTFVASPTRPPDRRIDYVMISAEVELNSADVLVNQLTALAADHYPVVAEIALPGPTVGIGRR